MNDDAWTRRLRLLHVLIHRGELATRHARRHTETDKRTALRDLKKLESHGVPLRKVGDGQDERWVLSETWRQMGMRIDPSALFAMRLGRQVLAGILGPGELSDGLERLETQLGTLTEETPTRQAEYSRRLLYVSELEKDYSAHRQVIAELWKAMTANYRVNFDYRSAGSAAPKPWKGVCPLSLGIYKRGLYVWLRRRNEIRTLAVERIANLTPQPTVPFDYPRPSEYDPIEKLSQTFGLTSDSRDADTVTLLFHPAVADYAGARRWMPNQTLTTATHPGFEGWLQLQFLAKGPELVSRVLEWGDKVYVVEPDWLRDRVIDELQNALARYC